MIKMDIDITIEIPEIWGSKKFEKTKWAPINFLIGPNGTGKSLFAQQLYNKLKAHGYKVKFLNSERLSGFEMRDYSRFSSSNFIQGLNLRDSINIKSAGEQFGLSTDAYFILKEKLDVKIKIEALLSDIFHKKIHLVEEGGFLVPKMQDRFGKEEYNLKERECHGLKEIITILTFLYVDEYDSIIIDEPEMHLHPQFQSFLMTEFKKLAGDPKENPEKKLIFIITHSPYFIDIKDLDDLKNIIIFHSINRGILPTFIEDFDEFWVREKKRMRRFFAKFNTHHKQLFFANHPLFVEGYTDKQIISTLLEKLEENIAAVGSCIIEVGGKDQLAIFFKLCKKFKIDARFIADLDVLFEGKLLRLIPNEELFKEFLSKNGTNVKELIGGLWKSLDDIKDEFIKITTTDVDLLNIINWLNNYNKNKPKELQRQRYSLLLGLNKFKDNIKKSLSIKEMEIETALGKFEKLILGFKETNIFILRKGPIENYYVNSPINYLKRNGNKDKYFEVEYEYLLNCYNKNELENKFKDLIDILKDALPLIEINLKKHLRGTILEWFQKLQRLVNKGEIKSESELKNHSSLKYSIYNQLFDLIDFNFNGDRKFNCKIKVKQKIISDDNDEPEFNDTTVPNTFWN